MLKFLVLFTLTCVTFSWANDSKLIMPKTNRTLMGDYRDENGDVNGRNCWGQIACANGDCCLPSQAICCADWGCCPASHPICLFNDCHSPWGLAFGPGSELGDHLTNLFDGRLMGNP